MVEKSLPLALVLKVAHLKNIIYVVCRFGTNLLNYTYNKLTVGFKIPKNDFSPVLKHKKASISQSQVCPQNQYTITDRQQAKHKKRQKLKTRQRQNITWVYLLGCTEDKFALLTASQYKINVNMQSRIKTNYVV